MKTRRSDLSVYVEAVFRQKKKRKRLNSSLTKTDKGPSRILTLEDINRITLSNKHNL